MISQDTRVFFLHDKSEVASIFKKFAKKAQNEFDCKIKKIRSDNGKEFDNTNIHEYCDEIGIKHEVSVTYTSQQNGVVERKNRTLITLARTMIDEYNTPERFGPKLSILHVMHQTGYFLNGYLRRLPMNC
jgi:transposase InsO family protein